MPQDYKPLLPQPLMDAEHTAAFDPIIRNLIASDTDLTNVDAPWFAATILNIDTVPAAVLPYLAVMFGVEGYKGFDYAPTEVLQRQTIKNAIPKKRKMGTKWAVRTALEDAGFLNVQIFDKLGVMYWGQIIWDGSFSWNSGHWAHFRVEMEPPVGVTPAQVDMARVMLLINYWKREVTLCVDVTIKQIVITSFGVTYGTGWTWGDGIMIWDGNEMWGG